MWVQCDGPGQVTASPGLLTPVLVDGRVEVLPNTGRYYTPAGPNDETAVFLRARRLIGDNGLQVFGHPPLIPETPEAGRPDPDVRY